MLCPVVFLLEPADLLYYYTVQTVYILYVHVSHGTGWGMCWVGNENQRAFPWLLSDNFYYFLDFNSFPADKHKCLFLTQRAGMIDTRMNEGLKKWGNPLYLTSVIERETQ